MPSITRPRCGSRAGSTEGVCAIAQHDYDIADGSGAAVLADLGNLFDAIVTNNSGTAAPSTTFAHQWWFDTTNALLKQRNEANDAWVTVASKVGNDWIPYSKGLPLQIGEAVGNVIALESLGDTAATPTLPPVDGSQLTGLSQGAVLQVVHSMTAGAAGSSGGTEMVFDNSIPQNTEGNEFLLGSITPISATSKLLIEVTGYLASSTGTATMAALFKDSGADAIEAAVVPTMSANIHVPVVLRHYRTAGGILQQDYKFRAGLNTPGTSYFGTNGSGVTLGALLRGQMTLTEIAA